MKITMKRPLGFAIVYALGLLALVSAMAAITLASASHSNILLDHARERQAIREELLDAVEWARAILVQDGKYNTIDYLGEAWASANLSADFPQKNGSTHKMHISIEDAQSRFNLNSLGASYIEDSEKKVIAGSAEAYDLRVEFLSQLCKAYNNEGCFGFASEHLTLSEPAELSDAHNHLGPLFSAWPSDPLGRQENPEDKTMLNSIAAILPVATPINVNTAPEPLLKALFPSFSPSRMAEFLSARKVKPIESISALTAAIEPAPLPNLKQVALGFSSSFFFAHISITSDEINFQAIALIHRDEAANTHLVGIRQNTNMNGININEDPQFWLSDDDRKKMEERIKEDSRKDGNNQ